MTIVRENETIDCASNDGQSDVRIASTSKSSPIYEILLCLWRQHSLDIIFMRLSKFPCDILIQNKLVSRTQRSWFPGTGERWWNALCKWLEELWGFCLLSNRVNEIPSKVQATKCDVLPARVAALRKSRLNTKNYKKFKRTINTIVYIFSSLLFAVQIFRALSADIDELSSTIRRDRSSTDTRQWKWVFNQLIELSEQDKGGEKRNGKIVFKGCAIAWQYTIFTSYAHRHIRATWEPETLQSITITKRFLLSSGRNWV